VLLAALANIPSAQGRGTWGPRNIAKSRLLRLSAACVSIPFDQEAGAAPCGGRGLRHGSSFYRHVRSV